MAFDNSSLADTSRAELYLQLGIFTEELGKYSEAEERIEFEKKDFKKAEEYFLAARKTAGNTPGDKHPLTARIALALARTELIVGNTDSAMSYINDALRITTRASGPAHPFTAQC